MTEPGTLDIEELERLYKRARMMPQHSDEYYDCSIAAVHALPVLIARIRELEEAYKDEKWKRRSLEYPGSIPTDSALIKAKEPRHDA